MATDRDAKTSKGERQTERERTPKSLFFSPPVFYQGLLLAKPAYPKAGAREPGHYSSLGDGEEQQVWVMASIWPSHPTTLFAQAELAPIHSRKLPFYNVSNQESWQLDRGIIFLYDLADRTNEGEIRLFPNSSQAGAVSSVIWLVTQSCS